MAVVAVKLFTNVKIAVLPDAKMKSVRGRIFNPENVKGVVTILRPRLDRWNLIFIPQNNFKLLIGLVFSHIITRRLI